MSLSPKILLLLDYDGTLTPIRERPALARLSSSRRRTLRTLSRHKNFLLAIISGRKLSDLKKMVDIPGLIYIGNHGFEISLPGHHFVHPAAKHFAFDLARIKKDLSALRHIKGVLIEDKDYTLSIHYRLIPARRLKHFYNILYRTLRPWRKRFELTRGKKVFEIRPPVVWDKGKAVKWISRQLRAKEHRLVYIGDDRTDEDAFRALQKKGMTIHVGKGRTAAKTRLKNVSRVYRYLKGLINNES
jgi:trehalose-phosphatase